MNSKVSTMHWRYAAGIAAGLSLCSPVAQAEDVGATTTEGQELPPLVVTGTRLTAEPLDQPYAFYRASDEELDTRVGRTPLDRLNYGPGIFLQRTAPNQASPFIRGLTGEQTLLLLDGVRFNHAMMRPGPNQYAALVPEASIDSLDAILGSSSTVNGSDGLTGGLDFRLAPAGRGVDSPLSPWIASRVDSGNGGTLELGADGVTGNWAYSIDLSGSMFHDRVGGDDFRDHVFSNDANAYDEIPNTAYDALSGGFRLAYFGIDNRVIEMDAGLARQMDAPRPDGYAENSGRSDRVYRYFDPQQFSFVHLRDQWQIGSRFVDRLQTTLWWHQFGEEQFRSSLRTTGAARRREYDDTLDAYGIDLQATTLLGADDQHELTWGATYIYEVTDNSYREYRTPAGSMDLAQLRPYNAQNWANNTTISDDSTYTTLGFFAQDNWRLSQMFSVLAGARYSRYDWSFGDVDGDADDVTGNLRGMMKLTENNRLFVGASKGFRAPNLTNLDGVVDRGSSGRPAQGNPDLDPEVSYTYETGWKWREDRDQAAVTVFYTEIDDLIQRDFSGSGEFTNVEGAEIRGAECEWDYGIDFGDGQRLALVGAASYVKATRDIPVAGGGTVEDNLSRANRLYGRVGLKYEPNLNWWGLLQCRWHDDYDDVATHPSDSDANDIRLTIAGNADGSMPGYALVDVMCGWQSDDGNRRIGLFVENVADETYREPGSGTDGVGRSIGITAGLRL